MQTNSDLIFLLVIVSLFPFFLFLLLTVPDSDNFKENYNFSKPVFFGTLCSVVLVFSFVKCLTQECLT